MCPQGLRPGARALTYPLPLLTPLIYICLGKEGQNSIILCWRMSLNLLINCTVYYYFVYCFQ